MLENQATCPGTSQNLGTKTEETLALLVEYLGKTPSYAGQLCICRASFLNN